MGYTTDFIGHIGIHPVLNDAEQAYLQAFAASRRFARAGGAYDVPGNPRAENRADLGVDTDTYNAIASGQPSLWCGWTPSWDGCCLSFDGIEKFYHSTAWLVYLIDHFLRSGAQASKSRLECFADFTFDHQLDGTIAACRRDTRELYLIRVTDNRVSEQTLVEPEPQWFDLPALPYEEQIDTSRFRRRRRSTPT